MRIIAGEARSRTILAPEGRDTRPTLDRVRGKPVQHFAMAMSWGRGCWISLREAAPWRWRRSAAARRSCAGGLRRPGCAGGAPERGSLGFSQRARVLQADWRETVRKLSAEGRSFQLVFLDPLMPWKTWTAVFEALRTGGVIDADSLVIVEHQLGIHPRWGKAS